MARAHTARQPALGLAGITLVIPVMVVLGVGFDGAERSLLVLGPISTYSLPVIALVGFWWNDWPGTTLRPPLTGLLDTLLVIVGGVVFTIAAQAVVAHADLRGVFDSGAGASHARTFPATMPLAGAIFVAMLELTLVSERWPLRHVTPIAGGVAALAAAWGIGILLYQTLVADAGPVPRGQFGAALVCVAVLQVAFYVVLRGWPFSGVRSRTLRLGCANLVVIAGGVGIYLLLYRLASLRPATISAVGGAAVAAGLVIGMQFEGWPDSALPPGRARLAALAAVAIATALIYVGLTAYAHSIDWTRAVPEEWVSYAGLNAIGVGVILHVAIGRRWPFASRKHLECGRASPPAAVPAQRPATPPGVHR
jgi:hypothetical protein